MKILQLISSGGFFGAENMVLQLSVALKRLGCDVVVGCFKNAHRPNTEILEVAGRQGLEVESFECAGRLDNKTVQLIRSCVRRREINVIHSHGYKANFYSYRAAAGVPVRRVATCHNWPGKTLSLRSYAFLDRLLLRRFDHIGAVSDDVKNSLLRSGVPGEKITRVDNGIDVDWFSRGKPVLQSDARFQNKRLVGYVGRIVEEKGLHFLLQAAKNVLLSFPDALFLVIGSGPYRESLEDLSRQLGIDGSVIFLGARSDLADIYASLDLFVLPSLGEGMPLVLLEAMAAKKPVVATKVGGIPDMLRGGEAGLLVEAGDVAGLQSAIFQLLQEPELGRTLGQRGWENVRSRFSSETMAEFYFSIYRGVVPDSTADAVFSVELPHQN